jgi:hypothetical protein
MVAALVMPPAAFAQQVQAGGDAAPSYARPSYATDEETISGRVASFDGKFHLEVRDDRGFVDDVQLHQGTVINPTGLQLRPGMSVMVSGKNAGSVFAANVIDTPYDRFGLVPMHASPDFALGIGIR